MNQESENNYEHSELLNLLLEFTRKGLINQEHKKKIKG